MTTGITKSVGKGAVNLPEDVAIVRQLLAAFVEKAGKPPLGTGPIDQPTIDAITRFQSEVLKVAKPDGCVDPGGKTITALLKAAPKPAEPAPVAPPPPPPPVAGEFSITYGNGVEPAARLVSPYAIEVIRKALAASGVKAAVMTSTLRLPGEQAATMYKNAVVSLQKQRDLYGPTGDAVLQVYADNKSQPKDAVIALMTAKIEQLLAAGKPVSNHVATPAGYAKRNVIDIGVNSTKAAAGASFSLSKLTKAFAKLQTDGYIAKFIDETGKSNTCWHVEIVPDAKPL